MANRAKGTKQQYFSHFKRLLQWIGKTADELREMKFQEDQVAKPWERNKVENLLRQYLESMEENYSCNSQKLAYNAVRSFFAANGMRLNLTRNDRPSGCAFGSRTPNKEEVRQIVDAAEHLRTRSLILFLKDSGLRESDAARLLWKDLHDYDEGFMGFTIQTKKQKVKARPFIGPETTSILMLYKEKRMKGTGKIPPEKDIEEHPVFALFENPEQSMRPDKMSFVIGRAIELAGLEGVTPHGLRKFWEQNNHYEHEAYQKQLNGRALSEVERAYFWKETPDLFEMYQANYHNLKVKEVSATNELVEKELKKRDEIIESLKNRINELERERSEYKLTESQVAELLRRIEKLEKQAQKQA